jgi:hypothetical protein
MNLKDAFWDVFTKTGYIGSYLLYKDHERLDASQQSDLGQFKIAVGSGDSSTK